MQAEAKKLKDRTKNAKSRPNLQKLRKVKNVEFNCVRKSKEKQQVIKKQQITKYANLALKSAISSAVKSEMFF